MSTKLDVFSRTLHYDRWKPHFTYDAVKGLWRGDPSLLPADADLGQWQAALRYAAKLNQDFLCPVCDRELIAGKVELHHALISREDVRGTPLKFRQAIHHTYNCLVIHHECHTINRQDGWRLLAKLYDEFELIDWYTDGLPSGLIRPRVEVYLATG